MMTEMNAVKNRTGNGVLRRGVALLAVLLLVSVLMAGAVSATNTFTISLDKNAVYVPGDGTTTVTLTITGTPAAGTTYYLGKSEVREGVHAWNASGASGLTFTENQNITTITVPSALYDALDHGVNSFAVYSGISNSHPKDYLVDLNTRCSNVVNLTVLPKVDGVEAKTIVMAGGKSANYAKSEYGHSGNEYTPVIGNTYTYDPATADAVAVTASSRSGEKNGDTWVGTLVGPNDLTITSDKYVLYAEKPNNAPKTYIFDLTGMPNGEYSLQNLEGSLDGACQKFTITGDAERAIVVKDFANLKSALEAGANVKLGADITTETTETNWAISIPGNMNPNLDLNNHQITVTGKGTSDESYTFGFIGLGWGASSPATLTITDTGTNGKITVSKMWYMIAVGGKSTLIMNGGNYHTEHALLCGGTGTFDVGQNPNNRDITIDIKGDSAISNEKGVLIYLPCPGGKLTITENAVLTSDASCVDMCSGTLTISGNAKISSTGPENTAEDPNSNGSLDDGSTIVVERGSGYGGNIAVNILSKASISSVKGSAISNYIVSGNLNSEETVTFTVSDESKLSGSDAAIANKNYKGKSETQVGIFNLNGGYYKFTGAGGVVLKEVTPAYPPGYSMTKQADTNGYHFVTKAVEPEIKETVQTDGAGKTTISAPTGSTLNYDEATKTVTMKDATSGVTLEVTYDSNAQKSGESVSGTVNSIVAKYESVELDSSKSVSLDITLEGSNPADVKTNLPSIVKSVKENLVKTSLSANYNNVQILTMFEALSSDIATFNAAIKDKGVVITFKVPVSAAGSNPVFFVAHFDANGAIKGILNPESVENDGTNWIIKATATSFSGYAPFTGTAKSSPVYSGSGNMNNAFRVLFETQGGSYVSPATGLSYGDKITAPVNPVRDGYTFGGWYKDAACTQAWSFSDAIDGDMTLYAKWTGGSAAQQTTTETAAPTAQPTAKQTTAPAATTSQSPAAATTAAPAATTAAGVSPTLTQAPAPVFGALLGLLAASVLLRRRE